MGLVRGGFGVLPSFRKQSMRSMRLGRGRGGGEQGPRIRSSGCSPDGKMPPKWGLVFGTFLGAFFGSLFRRPYMAMYKRPNREPKRTPKLVPKTGPSKPTKMRQNSGPNWCQDAASAAQNLARKTAPLVACGQAATQVRHLDSGPMPLARTVVEHAETAISLV